MNRDLAEALRRDDLWLDACAPMQLLSTVSPGRRSMGEPAVLLVELRSGRLVQVLVLEHWDGDTGYDIPCGFVPLTFGPVQEGVR